MSKLKTKGLRVLIKATSVLEFYRTACLVDKLSMRQIIEGRNVHRIVHLTMFTGRNVSINVKPNGVTSDDFLVHNCDRLLGHVTMMGP